MAYIGAGGNVGGTKSTWKSVTDFFSSILNFFVLFFQTFFNFNALEQQPRSQSNRTYAQRNNGRSYRGGNNGQRLGNGGGGGGNIRGLSDAGSCNAPAVGG